MKNVKKAFMAIAVVLMMAAVFSACSKEEDPTPPVPGFDYSPAELVQWDMVTFTNTTTGGESYSWDFGDGFSISIEENPTHQYMDAGTYTVTLTATNEDGDKSISKDLTVSAPVNVYTIDGAEYNLEEAFEYSFMGGTPYWRMLGELFPGNMSDTTENLIKFYPNIGTGTLEGSYTFMERPDPDIGTFDYGFTASYAGMQYDSTMIGSGGSLTITKYSTDIYEFKLENGLLKVGAYDWGTGEFILNGTELDFTVLYRGYVEPLTK